MPPAPPLSPARAVFEREIRVRYGPVPDTLGGVFVAPGRTQLSRGAFLLRVEDGPAMLYRKGEGIVVARAALHDPAEEELYLRSSMYSAVACINGFLPLHASAVASDGGVYAFTGPSGAGKSTLAAALGQRGLPLFCDDTLVVDTSQPARIIALPGHKRLKLWPDALALAGATATDQVAARIEKFYAIPAAGDVGHELPLRMLIFLEFGDAARIVPMTGADKLGWLDEEHYTTQLYTAANGLSAGARFAFQAQIARELPMARFIRPRDPSRFGGSLDMMAAYIAGEHPR